MDVICAFLDADGNAHLRGFGHVDTVETIHVGVLKHLSDRRHTGWTFILAFELTRPVPLITDFASHYAWQPTKQQFQELWDLLFKEELRRLQDRDLQ